MGKCPPPNQIYLSYVLCSTLISLFYSNRKVVSQYGLWDQIRVDHGKEWYLMLSIQRALSNLRRNVFKAPYMQTSSKKVRAVCCIITLSKLGLQNHIVERMWSEVNTRVNYPIKTILVRLLDGLGICLGTFIFTAISLLVVFM